MKRLNLKNQHPLVDREIEQFLINNTEFSEAALKRLEIKLRGLLNSKESALPELRQSPGPAAIGNLTNEEQRSVRLALSKASQHSRSVTHIVLTELAGSKFRTEKSITKRF